jgi:PIN domain nuclease of toxin-antitoxin system
MTYLDTHVALELCQGDLRKIGKLARKTIETDDDLRISPMTLLEFEYMRMIDRVKLSALEIAQALATDLGVRICDVSFIGIARQALEEGWTTDPFDRLILAQARWQKAKLITRDSKMQDRYERAFC